MPDEEWASEVCVLFLGWTRPLVQAAVYGRNRGVAWSCCSRPWRLGAVAISPAARNGQERFSCTEAPRQSREQRNIAGRRGEGLLPQGRIRRRALTDRFGRKKLFMITLGIYVVAAALTALSSHHELRHTNTNRKDAQ